jgi:hypothetical protein
MMSFLRSSLILRRAATLLTVWSNCLAGWWLGGAGRSGEMPFLFVGATLLYLGGTLWSDAFTTELDRADPAREPISSAAKGVGALQGWGLGLLALGVVGLFWLGKVTGGLGIALVGFIMVAHVLYRLTGLSIVLPGICRFLLYLIGASTGPSGVTGGSIWCGLALAVYVTGVSFVPRQKDIAGPVRHWPILLLAIPILLALVMDDDGRREAGLLLSAVLGLWTVRCLRPALWSAEKDFAGAVGGLVAGIIFVDLLAAANAPKLISAAFIALFLLTRLVQRLAVGR